MENTVTASHWKRSKENTENKDIKCLLCPHCCTILDGHTGKCSARTNSDGTLIASNYGQISSIALDPIEKKPLYEYHCGSKILSIGSYGCNFRCPFCQNHKISMEYENVRLRQISPQEIAKTAAHYVPDGNIGVAYTYNEPLIGYEFVRDCSELVKNEGLLNILVTNGYINEAPLKELLPLIDAMNIDIKGGADGTYNIVGGTLNNVKRTVELAYNSCHIEITTLVIQKNNEGEVEEIAKWIASIDRKIPYHLSRFFPNYKYTDRAPTPRQTMLQLRDIAEQYLDSVYLGNM